MVVLALHSVGHRVRIRRSDGAEFAAQTNEKGKATFTGLEGTFVATAVGDRSFQEMNPVTLLSEDTLELNTGISLQQWRWIRSNDVQPDNEVYRKARFFGRWS